MDAMSAPITIKIISNSSFKDLIASSIGSVTILTASSTKSVIPPTAELTPSFIPSTTPVIWLKASPIRSPAASIAS